MAGGHAVARGIPRDEITKHLVAWSAGDQQAATPAFAALYATLRRLARRALSTERSEHTLGTAGLIGEAFFRLLEQQRIEWRSREHFIATAAQMMRRILIDHARGRSTVKRGGGAPALSLDQAAPVPIDSPDGLVAIHDALEALAEVDRMPSQIVELRFFGGMTHAAIALYLGVSPATIERRWRLARAWLYRRLKDIAG